MKTMVIASGALLGLLAFLPNPARAQALTLECGGSDICVVETSGISYDTISWNFNKGSTDAIFPQNCMNQLGCTFYCPRKPGRITVGVKLFSNNQLVASTSTSALCTAQPL